MQDRDSADSSAIGRSTADTGTVRLHGDRSTGEFAETIRETFGREPCRPAGFENLEKLPQRFEVMDADAGQIKHYIAAATSRSV
jgi:threonine synthase